MRTALVVVATMFVMSAAQCQEPGTRHNTVIHRMSGHHFTRIVGDRRTHRYHVPGDTGTLPSSKNRVYFSSERDARNAGYQHIGARHRNSVERRPLALRHPGT